jgi:hypothetical protein
MRIFGLNWFCQTSPTGLLIKAQKYFFFALNFVTRMHILKLGIFSEYAQICFLYEYVRVQFMPPSLWQKMFNSAYSVNSNSANLSKENIVL